MRILAVTTSFPRSAADSAGRFVYDLHAGLVEEGHEVLTLCPEAPGAPPREVGEAGEVERLAYDPVPDLFYGDGLELNWGRVRHRWRKLRAFQEAARGRLEARSGGGDAFLGHWLWPGAAIAAAAARRCHLPAVGIGHGGDLHLLGRPLLGRLLARRLQRGLRGALCTNRGGARIALRRLGWEPERIVVAPMGIDPRPFDAPEEPGALPWPGGALLGVGRLIPIKGFDLLVAAGARLGHRVVILGEGPERPRLEADARRLGTALWLPGAQPREVVAAAMASAAAVVIPSRRLAGGRAEGCPVAAVEALYVGAPLVASATGGLPDLVPSEDLFRGGDLDALCDALRRRLGPGARRRPRPAGLTRRETARSLLSLFEAITGNRQRSGP